MTRTVRFITRSVCRICEEAYPIVAQRAHRKGWDLETIDVDDTGLAAEFGDRVPVVVLDGIEVLSGRFDKRQVRRALS